MIYNTGQIKSEKTFDPKDYEAYLERHLGNVQLAYEFLVESGIIEDDENTRKFIKQHDRSKYETIEFDPYGERFYGKYKDSDEDDPNFKYAWLHHQHNNPHHWQYWCLLSDDNSGKVEELDMPESYIVEMICDWMSFSIDKGDLSELGKWYKKNKSKQMLSAATKSRVEALLENIENKKYLYKTVPKASIELKKSSAVLATSEKQRSIIERRLRGTVQDLPNARDSEFDPGVYELLRQNPKLINYIEPWMDTSQVVVIQDAIDSDVDIKKLNNPNYNWMQMTAILDYLKQGIDVTKYTHGERNALIIRQIGEAIKQGMTDSEITHMLTMNNWQQMREIRLGYRVGIDVKAYFTNPQMELREMQKLRKELTEKNATASIGTSS